MGNALVAFAVLLQTVRLLAAAPAGVDVFDQLHLLHNLGSKRIHAPLLDPVNSFATLEFMDAIVGTVHALAPLA